MTAIYLSPSSPVTSPHELSPRVPVLPDGERHLGLLRLRWIPLSRFRPRSAVRAALTLPSAHPSRARSDENRLIVATRGPCEEGTMSSLHGTAR